MDAVRDEDLSEMFGVGGGVGNQMSPVSTLLKNNISNEISCYFLYYLR